MSFSDIKELLHAIEMWRGVQRVEFKDVAAQPSVEPTVENDEPLPADKYIPARIKLL
jgi:hypothetical protein